MEDPFGPWPFETSYLKSCAARSLMQKELDGLAPGIVPFVIELTFFNVWEWDFADKIQQIMPAFSNALRVGNAGKLVWIYKLTYPFCDRYFGFFVFFGDRQILINRTKIRKTILQLMRKHEEITGYNIVEIPGDISVNDWLLSFCNNTPCDMLLESGILKLPSDKNIASDK